MDGAAATTRYFLEAAARLPLPARRRLLRARWFAEGLSRRDTGFGVTATLERTLRLPRRDAVSVDRELVYQDQLQALEWLAASRRSEAELARDDRHVRIADPQLFRRLAATGEPVILAPMHMGVFSLGLLHIAYHHFAGRRLLVLRAREDRETDTRAMRRLTEVASEFRFLNIHDRADFMPAMRFAREGALIICFMDLPARYGNPAEVRLFSQPARIALGLDALARMTAGTVVPVAVASGVAGDVIHAGRPFNVVDASAAARAEVARRLAADIQSFLAAHPGQWHFWSRLGEFLGAGAANEGAGGDAVAH